MHQRSSGAVRVGISGWTYPPWRGVFYPRGLPHRAELAYAAEQLSSIEINGSFYSLQLPTSYQRWHDETPDDFEFAVKGPRFITHMKKLNDVETPLANFFASGVLALAGKLGPVLWQLPPNLGFDTARLGAFVAMLPRTTGAAAELASRHDQRMEGRSLTTTPADRRLRHALEVRHPTYETPELVDLLREHDVALVCADTAGVWPMLHDVSSDFVYVRLHGADELYVSGYGEAAVATWSERVRCWRRGGTPTDGRTVASAAPRRRRDVYVYFDNDTKVHAPFDAMALAQRLAAPPPRR